MKKLIFLTSAFYPMADANGVCVKNAADELIKLGFNVSVLCEGSGQDENVGGISIIHIKDTISKRLCAYAETRNSMFSRLIYRVFLMLRRVLLGVASPLIFPNVSPFRTNAVYKKLEKLYADESFDYVIGTFRPYENVEAVNRFKSRHPEVKSEIIYFDLLDGKNPFGKRLNKFFDKLCIKSERYTFGINDVILIPKSSVRKYVSKCYDFAKDKIRFFDFPLFTSTENMTQKKENNGTINIVYAGTVDGKNRSAEYFLKLTENLKSKFNMNICVEFYGDFTEERVKRKYENVEFVKFRGKVEPDKVFDILCSADCLLNLSNIITYEMVPSKIFQMFSTCNKIVNVVENEKDKSLEYFNKYAKVLNIREYNRNIEDDTELLKEFIENKDMPEMNFNKIRNTYIKNTPGEFINAMTLTE